MRNSKLKQKRVQRMVELFHEMYNVKRLRLEDVLQKLSDDHFYLNTDYIYAQIFYNKENAEYYQKLLSKNWDKTLFPSYNKQLIIFHIHWPFDRFNQDFQIIYNILAELDLCTGIFNITVKWNPVQVTSPARIFAVWFV